MYGRLFMSNGSKIGVLMKKEVANISPNTMDRIFEMMISSEAVLSLAMPNTWLTMVNGRCIII